MSITMNAFGHDIKNMAFNLIKSEPILFVADKVNLNCVGFARDHIVLQMINMVMKEERRRRCSHKALQKFLRP